MLAGACGPSAMPHAPVSGPAHGGIDNSAQHRSLAEFPRPHK
jgi:hypothetical protein